VEEEAEEKEKEEETIKLCSPLFEYHRYYCGRKALSTSARGMFLCE